MTSLHDHLRDVHLYTAEDFANAADLGGSLFEEHRDSHEAHDSLRSWGRIDPTEPVAARITEVDRRHAAARRRTP